MKENEIRFLVNLDPLRVNCTVQELLIRPNILQMPYTKALEYLVTQTLNEKKTLQDENSVLSSLIKKHNLYTRDNILPNHKEK